MEKVVVGISEIGLAKEEQMLVTYALGSCVGVCLYDETLKIGGLLHAMLPDIKQGDVGVKPEKYVNSGVEQLYRSLCLRGADKKRMKAKLIGGAKMFEYSLTGNLPDIGQRNVYTAREVLTNMGIPIVGEMTGGVVGRTVRFEPVRGKVKVSTTDNQQFEF